jgi:hypothetical protein
VVVGAGDSVPVVGSAAGAGVLGGATSAVGTTPAYSLSTPSSTGTRRLTESAPAEIATSTSRPGAIASSALDVEIIVASNAIRSPAGTVIVPASPDGPSMLAVVEHGAHQGGGATDSIGEHHQVAHPEGAEVGLHAVAGRVRHVGRGLLAEL